MEVPIAHMEARRLGSLSPSLAPVWKFQRPTYEDPPTVEARHILNRLDADISEDLRKFRIGAATHNKGVTACDLSYQSMGYAGRHEAFLGPDGSWPDLSQGASDLLHQLLQFPVPRPPPKPSDEDDHGEAASSARDGLSIARHYGLTLEMFSGPAAPKLLLEQLSLRTLYWWWGPVVDLPAALHADGDDLDSAFLRLLVLLAISVVLDPDLPVGREMLEFLRLQDPEGPFACRPAGDAGGGFHALLSLAAQRPIARGFDTFLMPWAERRGSQVAVWLNARLGEMMAGAPLQFAALRALRVRRRIRHMPATHPDTGEVKEDETECRLQCQGTLLPPIAFLTGVAGQWDGDIVLWVASLAQAMDGEFQSRMRRAVGGYAAVYGDVAEFFALPPRNFQQLYHRARTEWVGKEMPRVGNAIDSCRCGVVAEAEHIAPLLDSLECEVRRTGGEALQLENGFNLAWKEPAAEFGYRSIVMTYRFISEHLTYADAVPHLEEIAMVACAEVDGIQRWAQIPKVATQRMQLLVQVQVTLPLFRECDQACHWPCAFTRHQSATRPLEAFVAEASTLASGLS
eukprot:GGOE01042862.1.p1 GENE.GGOE01042862.1~~GGOE01042862.1.p1  ORF type:complete len:571 (+),score=137.55 GGOE01042862.1:34-1746(+)